MFTADEAESPAGPCGWLTPGAQSARAAAQARRDLEDRFFTAELERTGRHLHSNSPS